MKNKVISLALALAFLVATTTFAPPATALPRFEIDTTYYDECLDPIYEKVIGCYGEIYTWGTSSAGATYKNVVQIGCETSEYHSWWYVWNGSGWSPLPGMPSGC
jgi:hypothetical protein